jgi:hypothetical protein
METLTFVYENYAILKTCYRVASKTKMIADAASLIQSTYRYYKKRRKQQHLDGQQIILVENLEDDWLLIDHG